MKEGIGIYFLSGIGKQSELVFTFQVSSTFQACLFYSPEETELKTIERGIFEPQFKTVLSFVGLK